jgi:hypothetical protein
VRTGKTALWIAYRGLADWRGFLIELLTRLKAGKAQQLQDAAEKG